MLTMIEGARNKNELCNFCQLLLNMSVTKQRKKGDVMKFFDMLLSRKITSEQAIRSFKYWTGAGISGVRRDNRLYDAAFPQNNAVEIAAEIVDKELKRLDLKSKRKEQKSLFQSFYLKNKNELKISHKIGSKIDENLVLLFIFAIDQCATKKIIAAFEVEGEVALERYTKEYRMYYLRRWLLFILIDVGLSSTFEDLFSCKMDKAIDYRYELMLDDHIAKMTAELLITFDKSVWTALSLLNTEYDFSAVQKRAEAMSMFLDGVEKDDAGLMEMATTDYVEAMKITNL